MSKNYLLGVDGGTKGLW